MTGKWIEWPTYCKGWLEDFPGLNTNPDAIIWKHDSDEEFSVGSTKETWQHIRGGIFGPWKQIWKSSTPTKIVFHMVGVQKSMPDSVLVCLKRDPKLQFCRPGSSDIGKLGYASLTVWNMRTWKAMTVLPLGEDPPPITSVCFNHNGKLLAAAATDGMIHMFGILV
ncbi:hypothetical protein MTR67_052122 [Solanum verrucosum]|uniref:Uncharacterized protein n=1 Tax=Solanum verrucosum TaxID=315347 RepID=A0AAF0V6C0_SOLVR|nr:hypothetical protein MTR67_052122 [Solanum verrucosum]